MSDPRPFHERAREVLDGTTPGPWPDDNDVVSIIERTLFRVDNLLTLEQAIEVFAALRAEGFVVTRAEAIVLSEQRDAILALHVRYETWCSNCAQTWPCPTVRALGGDRG